MDLAARLRELVVTEWLGPYRLEYENFLTNLDTEYENEASDFLKDGHYDSNLGNTMPLAMSNALGVSLVILTSLPSTPCFYITPRSEPSTQCCTLHTHPLDQGTMMDWSSKKIKCRCWVNSHDKGNYIACAHHVGRHSSRRCLLNGQPCSVLCGCKGCDNPNGKRPITMKGSRHREPHKWQLMNTTDKYSADLKRGVWSEFENIFFSNIVRHLEANLMECDPDTLFHVICCNKACPCSL